MRELSVVVLVALTLAVVALAVSGGSDRSTLVPPPEAVTETLLRQLAAHRSLQCNPLLSAEARKAYPPKALEGWFREVESRTERVGKIDADTSTLAHDRAETLVVVEGSGRTLSLPVSLVREHGLWRIDRLPQPPF